MHDGGGAHIGGGHTGGGHVPDGTDHGGHGPGHHHSGSHGIDPILPTGQVRLGNSQIRGRPVRVVTMGLAPIGPGNDVTVSVAETLAKRSTDRKSTRLNSSH